MVCTGFNVVRLLDLGLGGRLHTAGVFTGCCVLVGVCKWGSLLLGMFRVVS